VPTLRVIDAPRPESIPPRVEDFLRDLGGPAWLHVPGVERNRVRAVSTLIHGNEPSGVRALHAWLRSGATPAVDALCFVASVDAALAAPGFAHRMLPGRADLNRCFLPPYVGREGELACEVLARLRAARPEALVDLHNNTGHNPAYGVGPTVREPLLALTALFGHRYVHSDLRLGALVEATQRDFPSVTIECGRAGDPRADDVARTGLERYLTRRSILRGAPDTEPMDVLCDPVRVCVRPGLRIAFGESRQPDAQLTVAGDIDRHNFEVVPPGTLIGWVEDGVWPLEARDAEGRERAGELFEVRDGALCARRRLIPIMMTTDATVALADCLFYVVQSAARTGGE
jgi:Succinylglutamate desuccinylase / Aspartoacylase family